LGFHKLSAIGAGNDGVDTPQLGGIILLPFNDADAFLSDNPEFAERNPKAPDIAPVVEERSAMPWLQPNPSSPYPVWEIPARTYGRSMLFDSPGLLDPK
jgi:hypothetical protein